MHYDTLDWLLSLAPIAVVLGLMVVRGWNAGRAGLAGWLVVLALAATRFEAGRAALGYAQVKALLLTADVALIIWAALLLYLIVEHAGGMTVIANALAGLTEDGTIQVLLLGWVFASFLQGLGGFGVPVAITAPLLIGLGVPQVRAVVIPAIGHGWAVTFGSLATSFVMLTNVTGLPAADLALPAALMLGVLGYLSGFMGAHALAGWRGVRRAAPYVLLTGTIMGAAQGILATQGLWTIGAIGGGLAGLGFSILWIGRGRSNRPAPTPAPRDNGLPTPTIRLALAGYVVLVALALVLRGIAPVKEFLGQWAIAIDIPATATGRGWTVAAVEDAGFGIPGHPGLIILYSSLFAAMLYRRAGLYAPGAERAVLRQSGRRAIKSAWGVFTMVAIAATMERAGMIDVLANGLSEAVPAALYPFVAPVIGALGAFVTGSNVNSNAVFAVLQRDTAILLGLPATTILGAQTAAAAVISVMSPAKVTVGCSTVGANEGLVIRWLLGYGVVVVAVVGAMAWIGVQIG